MNVRRFYIPLWTIGTLVLSKFSQNNKQKYSRTKSEVSTHSHSKLPQQHKTRRANYLLRGWYGLWGKRNRVRRPEVLFLLTGIFVQNSVEGAADPPTSEFFYVLKKISEWPRKYQLSSCHKSCALLPHVTMHFSFLLTRVVLILSLARVISGRK